MGSLPRNTLQAASRPEMLCAASALGSSRGVKHVTARRDLEGPVSCVTHACDSSVFMCDDCARIRLADHPHAARAELRDNSRDDIRFWFLSSSVYSFVIHGMIMHATCQASCSVASLCPPGTCCVRFCIDVVLQHEERWSTSTTAPWLRGKRHNSLCIDSESCRWELSRHIEKE